MKYDFEGWATKNNLRCSDGRVIRSGAFSSNSGKRVPLVWNHQHNNVGGVLGHADLEERSEGIYAKCSFNDSPAGKNAKAAVVHGDISSLSIWANNIQQVGSDVIHGVIREVSLVMAGANPGAFIESVMAHGEPMDVSDDEGIFYNGDNIIIEHADNPEDDDEKDKTSDDKKAKTVKEVIDSMNDDQKKAMAILIGQAIEDTKKEMKSENNKEDDEMKHNAFEGAHSQGSVLSHSDMVKIIDDAKDMGSLSKAIEYHLENGVLAHASLVPAGTTTSTTSGITVATGNQTYGFNDPSMLFPEYKTVNGATPEWISRNMDWVNKFMSKVHRTPFSRIKSLYANITEDEARARGYIKGKQKKEEVFTTLKRVTSPQTIFKKQKLDRDDVIDITDFDVITWIKTEMRIMLNEEIARAALIGDGRSTDSDDKIQEINVRPIAKDAALFNIIVKVTVPADAKPEEIAKETIKAVIRGRKSFKGSGKPDFWTTEDVTTEMLLLEDAIGNAMYKTEAELATKLRVGEIIPVEPMEGKTVTIGGKAYPLIGVIVNVADYNIGADKGGEINSFDDFDIDFNQMKYLMETRISGALIKPFAAMTIVLDKQASAGGNAGGNGEQDLL